MLFSTVQDPGTAGGKGAGGLSTAGGGCALSVPAQEGGGVAGGWQGDGRKLGVCALQLRVASSCSGAQQQAAVSRVRRTRALPSALVATNVTVSSLGTASTLAPGIKGARSVVSAAVTPANECTNTLFRKAGSVLVL